MQDELITYGIERTIYRLSISKYANCFTLKGGILLYAMFNGNFSRATMDIDLLANKVSNSTEEIKKIFVEIFSIECDDALKFDLNTMKVINITEFKKYHGVNISIVAFLDRTKIPISIDIGFGDIVYPEKVKISYPVLLGMEIPLIYAYSIYSIIAEKFEAIVDLGNANSRYKDFYDIYILAMNYDLYGEELQKAIVETFDHRETSFNNIVVFEDNFCEDLIRQNRWKSFVKKKRAIIDVEFTEIIRILRTLLEPIINAILKKETFNLKWNKAKQEWI